MRVFISHSTRDRQVANRIAQRLKEVGHEIVTIDRTRATWKLRLRESLSEADVVLAVLSRNSMRSEFGQSELPALALGEFAQRQQQHIALLMDPVPFPSYLSDFMLLDMSGGFEPALETLVALLGSEPDKPKPQRKSTLERNGEYQDAQVTLLQEALRDGRLTLVCGAGVSIGAGIPGWNDLLVRLLESMIRRIARDHPIDIGSISGKEFQDRHGSSTLIIGKYLKNNLGKDFLPELRNALYATDPSTCDLLDAIGDLARPQRDARPLDSIITFNFDSLIEENLDSISVRNRAIHTEAVKHKSNELPIYHVHGYLPRTGKIPRDTEVVFSEDAYHSQFIEPFSWSNLVQLTKLSQNTCLFVGTSLVDPNLRRLLDVSQRKNPGNILSHFIFKSTPQSSSREVDQLARLLEEQDANALGLSVLWVEDFAEIPKMLRAIAGVDV